MQTTDRNVHGTIESNGLVDAQSYHAERHAQGADRLHPVDWTTPGLKVTRLRLVSDPGHPVWDVSYCHGTLDGKPVSVQLPFSDLPKRGVNAAIIKHAIRDKVYAKGLGILNCISTLC